MMKKRRLKLTVIAGSLFGFCSVIHAQDKPLVPLHSWDLTVDTDYAARMAKELRRITLHSPKIAFIDNKKLAVAYADGEGASVDGTIIIPHAKQLGARERVESPLYKFHALIFDVDKGPEMANHLEWDAIRDRAQLMPTHDGGFAVHVDNQFMTYSNNFHLENKMTLEYQNKEPALTIGPRISESYAAAVSLSGRSLGVCHMLTGRHNAGGTRVTLYEIKTLKQIGETSEANSVTGCMLNFNVTDQAIYAGPYVVHPNAPAWQKINPRCMQCEGPIPSGNYHFFNFLNEQHILTHERNYQVLDLKGHEYYAIPYESGVGIDEPSPATNAPRIAYSDRQSKNESGHRWSIRLHVVDWKERHQIATLKFIQNALPAVHDGGLQLEALGVTDFDYALSPDGKKLAVLNRNSLIIYDLP
jgi:hypothetical protein